MGNTFGKVKDIAVTPTISTSAYTANDVVGGLLEFDLLGFITNGLLINQALLVDDDNESATLTLYLFKDAPTTIADSAAFAPTAADLKNLVSVVEFSSYTTTNSNSFCFVEDINNTLEAKKGKLWGYLVATATPTYTAATDLTVQISLLGEQ